MPRKSQNDEEKILGTGRKMDLLNGMASDRKIWRNKHTVVV